MERIRITADSYGRTRVYDADTGEEIFGIRSIEWRSSVDEICTAKLEFVCPETDAFGEVKNSADGMPDANPQKLRRV